MGNNFGSDFKKAHPEEIGANGVIKVCIGGGAGFIGSHIAKRLMQEVIFKLDMILLFISSPFFYVFLNLVKSVIRAAMSFAPTGKKTSS